MEIRHINKTITNRIVIRAWLKTGKKLGHASLQTRNCKGNNAAKGICTDGVYINIYPTGRGVEFLDRSGKEFKTKTLEEDIEKYKRKGNAPIEVELYSLKVNVIEEIYNDLVKLQFNFSLLGSTIFKDARTHNFCSLVFHLLQEAGINASLNWATYLKLGVKAWAPSGRTVSLIAIPFATYLSNKVFNAAKLFKKSWVDCEKIAKEFDSKFPIDPNADWNSILPIRRALFNELYPEYAGFYYQCPVTHLELLKPISNFTWKLVSFYDFTGKMGFFFSSFVVSVAAVYIPFAGLGPVANFAIVTPSHVIDFAKEVKKNEEKIPVTSTYLLNDLEQISTFSNR